MPHVSNWRRACMQSEEREPAGPGLDFETRIAIIPTPVEPASASRQRGNGKSPGLQAGE
jgi:hypothetical protein